MKKIVPDDAVLVPDNAQKVFAGEIYDVYQWPQEMFDGSQATFEMLNRPDTVQAICIVEDKLMVLEEEQPHSGKKFSFGGGRIDSDDESTLSAAKREIHEETGYRFKNWRLIYVKQPHTKIEQFVYIYLAWGVAGQDDAHVDAGEKIDIAYMTFEEVKSLSQHGIKYLNESQEIFQPLKSIEGLLQLPEFQGREVDR